MYLLPTGERTPWYHDTQAHSAASFPTAGAIRQRLSHQPMLETIAQVYARQVQVSAGDGVRYTPYQLLNELMVDGDGSSLAKDNCLLKSRT